MTSVRRNCADGRGRKAMAGLPRVCSQSPTRWPGWIVRPRRGWPGWTGRPCATGFIATTREGLPCRVEHPALNAEPGQRARQPEAIVARFITDDDPLILDGCSAQSAHQCANVAAGEPMNAWTVSIGSCNPQYPALLAQFDRGVYRTQRSDSLLSCHCRWLLG